MIEVINNNLAASIFVCCLYLIIGILFSYLISSKVTGAIETYENKRLQAILLWLTFFLWPLWLVKIIIYNPVSDVLKEIMEKL